MHSVGAAEGLEHAAVGVVADEDDRRQALDDLDVDDEAAEGSAAAAHVRDAAAHLARARVDAALLDVDLVSAGAEVHAAKQVDDGRVLASDWRDRRRRVDVELEQGRRVDREVHAFTSTSGSTNVFAT